MQIKTNVGYGVELPLQHFVRYLTHVGVTYSITFKHICEAVKSFLVKYSADDFFKKYL